MSTPAYDFALVAPFNTIFTNGERLLGVASTLGGASPGTHTLSRWFNLDKGGIFNLKFRATGAAVIRTGPNKAGLVTVLTVPANTTAQTQIYAPPGEFRMDIELAHAGGNCGVAFVIFMPDEVVYATDKDGWVFETATVPDDNELTAAEDPRLSLPVFSVLPNWRNGILERLIYLTDTMESETAAERPVSVRSAPRRQFDVEFMRREVQRARLDSFAVGVGQRHFLMPLYHEQHRPAGGLDEGDTQIDFPEGSLALREFMQGDLIMVTNGDPDIYEVAEVTVVDLANDRVTFTPGLDLAWPAGTRVMPLREAFISDRVDFTAPTDRVATLKLRFELVLPEQRFGPAWGYCSPLWRFPIDWGQGVQTSHDRVTYTLDNQTGPVQITDPGGRAIVGERVSVLLRGRSDLVTFRRFIAAANGRAERFYMPSFTRNIEPTADLDGDEMTVKSFGFNEYLDRQYWARTWVGVMPNDGSPTLYRKVNTLGRIDEKRELLGLDSPLPPVPLSQIERVQFIVPSRFDQDTFEFQHYVDEAKAVRVAVVTRSVDGTGMPDIECWTTSLIYPLETEDDMRPLLQITGGRVLPSPGETLGMDVGLVPGGGELRQPLKTYNESPDALDLAFSVDGGTIVGTVFHSTEASGELTSDIEITNGTLKVILLTTAIDPPEGVDLGFVIESGTLS